MPDAILEDAAERYNIPLGVLEGLAATEAPTWDTVAPGEGSVGRFQIHPIHAQTLKQEYGVTMEQLRWRPDIQVAYMVPQYAEIWNSAMTQGKGVAQAAWDIVHLVQKPAEQYRQRQINSILTHVGQEGGTMAGQTTGTTPPLTEWARNYLEKQYGIEVSKLMAPSPLSPYGGAAIVPSLTEEAAAEQLGDMEDWIASNAPVLASQYPESLIYASSDTGMTDYQASSLALEGQKFQWDKDIAEMEYNMQVKGWPIEKAAAEFANRVSAATTGATLAKTAEDIRASQMQRRAPAPNVPGGYQFYGDTSAWTNYGLTAPEPIPIHPGAFPDPWSEVQKGMGAVGPTAIPDMEFPAFPGSQGATSTIVQAYNNLMGGGAPTPPMAPMGPQVEPPGGWMTPAPPTVSGPTQTPAPNMSVASPSAVPTLGPQTYGPPPPPYRSWEEYYAARGQ